MKRILVVDDEVDIVELIQNRLEYQGYQVDVASDAVTALERIESHVPDLITLDILMPGIIGDNDKYGASLCEVLKQEDVYKEIPIIMVSALKRDSRPEIEEMVRQADDYITKPFNSDDLIKKIKDILKRKAAE